MWKTILDYRNVVIPSQDSFQSLQSKDISCHVKSLYKPEVQSIVSPQLVKKCKLAKCHHAINAKPLPSHCTTCTSQSDRLTLDNISSTERKACFPISPTSMLPLVTNKYDGIWQYQLLQGNCSLCYCNVIYWRELVFVCSMNNIRSHLFLSREDEDDVRDTAKHDSQSFHFTLCYLMIIP